MTRHKSISRTNNTVRLFVGDKLHIKELVKEFKKDDPRFATEATALRYFINIGISTQRATEDLRGSLDHTMIKESISLAVSKKLKEHSDHIEELQNLIKNLVQTNEQNFSDIANRATKVEDKLDQKFTEVINNVIKSNQTSEQGLRNIIVLRSIIYVFLLGIKTGKIPPGEDHIQTWRRIISIAHRRANELSVQEVNSMTGEGVEAGIIQKISGDIFKEILPMLPPIEQQ